MKDRRKNRKKRNLLFVLYLFVCLGIVVTAYFHLSRIARQYNAQHLELITGLYAEKMNESMEYLQSYATEDVEMIKAMGDSEPEEILAFLQENLDQSVFYDVGFVMSNGEILGSPCAVSDLGKKGLDRQSMQTEDSFISDPYQSSLTGNMVMTVFVPVHTLQKIHMLYVSIQIENLRRLGVYDLLQGKISVHLLKADSENYITCISTDDSATGSWNNLLLQQRYYVYNDEYSYTQWIRDMRDGKKEGRFSAEIRGEESTISYRNITSMPAWYVVVELTNRDISDITQSFSIWGGVYGTILVGFTLLYMLTILLFEKKDKKHYMGLSATDELTGILNRRAFQQEVEETLQKKNPGVFLFVDVDNFKKYNDTYGHHNGDLCLKHFARSMEECFPKESILGRYGGDEFVVYINRVTVASVYDYVAKFEKKIARLVLPTGEEVDLTASVGGAAFPEQGEDFISLCRSADVALYDVKRNGKAAFKMKEL